MLDWMTNHLKQLQKIEFVKGGVVLFFKVKSRYLTYVADSIYEKVEKG